MELKPGFVLAVSHEPLSFLRRKGDASVEEEQQFLEDHLEQNVIALAHNGCDAVRFHFYKGFGILAEREEMEMAREYVRLCHRHGVKVQLYVQFGTLYPETLLDERPDMMQWVQTDMDGRPISLVYGHQNCRLYPCMNRPGYWEYLKTIIRMAITEAGADAIGYDNITTAEEPHVCQCPECRAAFVGYLKAKYHPDTPEGAKRTKERFGHTVLDHILPPRWNYFNHAYNLVDIRNPVQQEWVLFRCESLGLRMKDVYDYSKSLNPDVLLEYNVYKQFGSNTAFVHGVYLPNYVDCLDAFWNECDEPASFTPDGELHSRIRGLKMAHAMGKACFTNHPFDESRPDAIDAPEKTVSYAESMAFGRGLITGVARVRELYTGVERAFKLYKRFAEEYPECFSGEPVRCLALYESKASLSFSNVRPWVEDMAMQQCLLRSHTPFDLVFSLDGIASYPGVVLPGAECLSAGEIDRLVAYVLNGGVLVLTGRSGDFDCWRRAWGNASLKGRLGLDDKETAVSEIAFGKGRIVHIPDPSGETRFDTAKLAFTAFGTNQPLLGPEYLKAPGNQSGIAAAVKSALGGALPLEVDAPEHVVAEFLAGGGSVYVHLINYRHGTDAAGIRIRLIPPTEAARAEALSPDEGCSGPLEIRQDGWIELPRLHCYTVVKVNI